MKKHLYFISVLSLLVLNGCSSDCNAFDYPPDHSVTLDAKTIEKYTIEDLSQGTGRMAQDGRRMEIQVQIKDDQKNILVQSVMNYEYPAAESYYNGPQVHGLPYPGNYPTGMAKAIMGMKEGGVRRFTLNEWTPIHGYAGTNKAFQEKATRYLNSAHPSQQMEEVANSIVLILDDYHLIENPAITQAVQQLLKYQPHHFHLVLGTRSYPQLALSRLRAQGQLLEVNTQGLQFSLAETQQYFHNHCAISLSAPDIVALHQRTEGWITGLHLAALSLRHSTHPSQDILNFTGSHRYVFDYLLEEVLATLTSEERSFLFKTSILNRLHPDLCQAVTGLGSGLLETLERNHLFPRFQGHLSMGLRQTVQPVNTTVI